MRLIDADDAIRKMESVMDMQELYLPIHFKEWVIDEVPTIEPLTDKEQRIFLAAMEREEKVCEEADRNYVREPYEDSLMRVCKGIRRKVKGALWT